MSLSKRLMIGALSMMMTTAMFAQEKGSDKAGPRRGGDEAGAKRHHMDKDAREKILKKYDKDGDGTLSEEERKVAKEGLQKHRGKMGDKIMSKFDKDGSGELNKEEVKALLEALRKRHQAQGEGEGARDHSKGRGPGRRSGMHKSDRTAADK